MSERTKTQKFVVQGTVAAGVLGLAALGVAQSLPAQPGFKSADAKQAETLATQAPAEDKVEAALYSRVMRLRKDIALTNQDLAALALSSEQSEAVLTRLLEWTTANEASLIAARRGVLDAKRGLSDAERAQRVGAERGGSLADLTRAREAVVLAERSRLALCDQGAQHALSVAPGSTQAQWADAAEFRGTGLPIELRYLSSMTEGRAEELAEALEASSVLPDQTLTVFEASGVSDVRTRINTHLQGVFAAEKVVLPLPAALRDDEAGMFLHEEPQGDGRP